MVGIIKDKILFYAGTCELIGGDTKYFCNLVNGVGETEAFDLIIATDKNDAFHDRAKQWLNKKYFVQYISTRPAINKTSFFSIIDIVLPMGILGRKLSKYVDLMFRLLFFVYLYDFIYNFRIFNLLFKNNKNIKIFHCNSGSFPGRIAGVAGILAAYYNNCPKIVMTIHNESSIIIDPLSRIYDTIVRTCCHHIIPVSENVKDSLIANNKFKTNKINIITIGLEDYEFYKMQNHFVSTSKVKIIIVGNYEEKRKGHEQLFQVIAELNMKYPNIMLVVAGTGSSKRRSILDKLAAKLKIENNIEWLGYIENIDELIMSCDIVAVPSIASEAIPYTIVEGLRAGKPMVISDIGGCSEAVVDNFNGYVVNPFDQKKMVDKFKSLLDNQERCINFGKNSRELFMKNFNQQDKLAMHLELYRKS